MCLFLSPFLTRKKQKNFSVISVFLFACFLIGEKVAFVSNFILSEIRRKLIILWIRILFKNWFIININIFLCFLMCTESKIKDIERKNIFFQIYYFWTSCQYLRSAWSASQWDLGNKSKRFEKVKRIRPATGWGPFSKGD